MQNKEVILVRIDMTDALKLENQLCHRFYTISNALTRAYRPLLDSLDITYPQYLVMLALWECDGVAIAELIDKTHIDGGALSLILKKLDQKGYITLKTDEADKRSRLVWLTETGHKAKQSAICIPEKMLCILNKLSLDDVVQLNSLLDRLQADLKSAESRR